MRTKFKGILTLLLAFVVQLGFAQNKSITGTVVDGDGLPIPGVNVIVKGTSSGTQTDFDGKYNVSASSDQTLVFSYVGFTTQEIKVGAQTTINVTLKPNLEELEEVVVTSYQGILKESEVVSASSNVKSEAIEQVPIASIDQVLQGNVAGANVRQASGQPGSQATVIIRGRSSLNGDIEPLYIIDGMPVNQDDFANINSNDIESMRVLKDAAATAIYGNRGAAGVIVITTKSAKKNENLRVQYRGLYGVSTLPRSNFDVMNTRQLLNYRKDVIPGNQFGDNLTDAEIEALANSVSTNWADIIQQNGVTESHDLVITSGGENVSAYTSLQYFNQEGVTLGSNLQRFSFRNNLSGNYEKFNFSTNVNASYSKNDFIVDATRGNNTGGQLDNAFIVPFLALPYLNPFNPDGSLNRIGTRASGALNPDGTLNVDGANGFLNTPFLALNNAINTTDRENQFRLIASGQASYNIIKNVTIGTTIGVDYLHNQDFFRQDPLGLRGLNTRDVLANEDFFGGTQSEFSVRDFSFNTNSYIRYTNTFAEDHTVNAAAFTEYFFRNFQIMGFNQNGLNPKFPGSSAGFTANNTLVDGEAVFAPTVQSTQTELALFSYFSNVQYDYKGKFGLDFTVRRDGTSRFQEENRFGTFYSVGARWNLNKESFMDNVDWVSDLKLRASYGQTGNQGVGGFFAGFQTIAGGAGYQNLNQQAPAGFVDENIIWETTTQANIGVDFGLFNNKLTGALDVYNKRTDDLFFGRNISPAGTGFSNVNTNVAVMDNSGVELQLSYDIVRPSATNDWKVNVFFNGAYNENEVVDIANTQGFIEAPVGFGQRIAEGERARVFFLQRWAGVDPANGQPLYYDAEGNITNILDRAGEGVYLDKQFDPVFTGGFGLNVSWKGFSLSSLFSYAAETYRMNSSLALIEDFDLAGITNLSTTMFDVWQQPGDVATIPAPSQAAGLRITSSNQTDRYLEDASFIRLRNAVLSYNVDKGLLDKVGMFSAIRLYAQGTNLITWSEWRGYDPESNDSAEFFSFPSPTTVSFGIDLTF